MKSSLPFGSLWGSGSGSSSLLCSSPALPSWHLPSLTSISLIMWNALYTAEKVIIRWTLLTEACYFGVQFLVVTATLAETGLMSLGILLLLVSRLLFVVISIYYYYQVGRRPKKA
ncbi:tumor protein p53-inducible protein 11 isoform X5 [Pongo pygmaeus]|uniref:tumor protein p53-inducible protein 11 isoform X7 n=1 Tax=Pongo abelii TaxID=9601 RepID=UPI000CF00B4B|nr:tumor protein p53-inducible protein 11 isoform X7 [Pongo abelii]XP_054294587.1 tumor protein p53-inducible protein 11 isoform X7 [Pongo pygmaeus]